MNELKENPCYSCRWYYKWFGICFNGNSPYCADCPPAACDEWEEKDNERSEDTEHVE